MAKKHLFIMLICCLVPIIGLTAVFVLGLPANGIFFYGMILLCPLLHLVMMRSMMGGHHDHSEHKPVPLTDQFESLPAEYQQ